MHATRRHMYEGRLERGEAHNLDDQALEVRQLTIGMEGDSERGKQQRLDQAERIGRDYVGLGSDFDDVASVIPGLEEVHSALLKAILNRGATEEQLRKAAGEDMMRVWQRLEDIGCRFQSEGMLPVEDIWEGRQ